MWQYTQNFLLKNYFSKNTRWIQLSICGLQFMTKSAKGIYRTTNAWTSSYNVTRLTTWSHFFYNCDITCMDRLLRSRGRDMSPRHVSSQGQDQLMYMARTISQQKEQTIHQPRNKKKLRGEINHEKKVYLKRGWGRNMFLSTATEISWSCQQLTTVISTGRGADALRTFNKTKTPLRQHNRAGLSPLAPPEEIPANKRCK